MFDQKFGSLEEVPTEPGIYTFLNDREEVIYVGKAKNLRRRLSQYRNAKRLKKHRKMKTIVRQAVDLRFEVLDSEKEALLRENQLLVELSPRLNVAGKFFFMYPSLGFARSEGVLTLGYSTEVENSPQINWFGSYRNRLLTRETFDVLAQWIGYLGHPHRTPNPDYSILRGFRQVPTLEESLGRFLRGESLEFLGECMEQLIEKPKARAEASSIQAQSRVLKTFFREEAKPLARVLAANHWEYLPQDQRDQAFIRLKD